MFYLFIYLFYLLFFGGGAFFLCRCSFILLQVLFPVRKEYFEFNFPLKRERFNCSEERIYSSARERSSIYTYMYIIALQCTVSVGFKGNWVKLGKRKKTFNIDPKVKA